MITGLTAIAGSSRLTLGLVFATAAVGKLANPGNYSAALQEFGFGDHMVNRALVVTVPACEGVLAAGLLSGALIQQAAIGAAVLLAAFSVLVARVLLRREKIVCRCFGNLSAGRLGAWALVRNLALFILAMSLIVIGHSSHVDVWPVSGEAYALISMLTLSGLMLIYFAEMAADVFTRLLVSPNVSNVKRKSRKGSV